MNPDMNIDPINDTIFSHQYKLQQLPPFEFDPINTIDLLMEYSPSDFPLKMTAVSKYIPKHKPHGEDAHFISPEFQTVGVADGVGSWRKRGIDSGDYARKLMANSLLALLHETPGGVDPVRVLQVAFDATKAAGSSTACILTLSGDKLVAANVGDSGFLVIRNDTVAFRSPIQQERFNCPFQLRKKPTKSDDPTNMADLMEVGVTRGDIVVVGTDGLLDNVHEHEIVTIVGNWSIGDDKDLVRKAKMMANVAFLNSTTSNRDSPYSIAAREASLWHRGGKPDDITIIIAGIHD